MSPIETLNFRYLANLIGGIFVQLLSILLISHSNLAYSDTDLDHMLCGEKGTSINLASERIKTCDSYPPSLNQGHTPWCAGMTSFSLINQLRMKSKIKNPTQKSADSFYQNSENMISLYEMIARYNKDNPNFDIDLSQSFNAKTLLLSLQKEGQRYLSEAKLPFDHIYMKDSKSFCVLKKDAKSFDETKAPGSSRLKWNLGDNILKCDSDFTDDSAPFKEHKTLLSMMKPFSSEQNQQQCFAGKNRIIDFEKFTKTLPRSLEIPPFRIYQFLSKNSDSIVKKLSSELKSNENRPIEIALCPSDIPGYSGSEEDCKLRGHSVVLTGSGYNKEGTCEVRFRNSWGPKKDSGNGDFFLSSEEFEKAIKNKVKQSGHYFSLLWLQETDGWKDDRFIQEAEGYSTFKGVADSRYKKGRSIEEIYYQNGVEEYPNGSARKIRNGKTIAVKNRVISSGGKFTGKVKEEEDGSLTLVMGQEIMEDGSLKYFNESGAYTYKNYLLSSGARFTGHGQSDGNDKVEFTKGRIIYQDGSEKIFDEKGNVRFKDYTFSDNSQFTGLAKIDKKNNVSFINGKLIEIKNNRRTITIIKNKKIVSSKNED